jgi:GTP-binding protein Era
MPDDATSIDETGATAETAGNVRVGFCAMVGLPNAGKSTLLNRVLDRRLAAVSRKPQTTRNRILGVFNTVLPRDPDQAAQLIFLDTPGIQHGEGALRRFMRDQSLGAVGDSDVILLMVDVADPHQRDPERFCQPDAKALVQALERGSAPVVLALNKIDALRDKQALLPVIEAYAQAPLFSAKPFSDIIPLSARTGEGVPELVQAVGQRLPVGPRLFPEDMVTDRAERFLAAELIREQLFHQLGQELPYATAVVVDSIREHAARDDVTVSATIYVERDSQKGMVVGKGGRRIKQIGQHGREAISQLFGCPVHVKLYVKVATNWSRVERGIREMGYE